MRGAQSTKELMGVWIGIIPACAGSTRLYLESNAIARDHPRVCGEHVCELHATDCLWGSSPRVRGARASRYEEVARSGIIPACAGSTSCPGFHARQEGDHPRVCGEHALPTVGALVGEGSSPRVRGAQGGDDGREPGAGIIPAWAGSTGWHHRR